MNLFLQPIKAKKMSTSSTVLKHGPCHSTILWVGSEQEDKRGQGTTSHPDDCYTQVRRLQPSSTALSLSPKPFLTLLSRPMAALPLAFLLYDSSGPGPVSARYFGAGCRGPLNTCALCLGLSECVPCSGSSQLLA